MTKCLIETFAILITFALFFFYPVSAATVSEDTDNYRKLDSGSEKSFYRNPDFNGNNSSSINGTRSSRYRRIPTFTPVPILNTTPTPVPDPTPEMTPTSTATPTPSTTATPSVTATPAPPPTVVTTNEYFVAKNGNDTDPGTEEKPWRTIKMAADTIVAGDIVYVRGGTYYERINPKNSGTFGKWLNFTVYPGEKVILDGTGLSFTNWEGLINIIAKQYISVSGFTVINSPEAGVRVGDYADHIEIMDLNIINTVHSAIVVGLKTGNRNNTNITIYNNTIDRPYAADWVEAISISGGTFIDVSYNTILQNGNGECIDLKDGTNRSSVHHNIVSKCSRVGIYIDSWETEQHDIDVYNNIVNNSKWGFMAGSEKGGHLYNVSFWNNIAYDNTESGFVLSSYSDPGYTPWFENISFINNNAYHNGYNDGGSSFLIDTWFDFHAVDIIVRNNIASQAKSSQIKKSQQFAFQTITIDYNLIDGYRGSAGEVYGTNHVAGDPMFIQPSKGDFHLGSASPAINNGTSLMAPDFDFDGNPRPNIDGRYDIGAFEVH